MAGGRPPWPRPSPQPRPPRRRPPPASAPVPPPAPISSGSPAAPLFSAALATYLELREGAGENRGTISTARMRADVFLAVMGDKPIDEYLPHDLQKFVNAAQFLPLAYGKGMPELAEVRAMARRRRSGSTGRKMLGAAGAQDHGGRDLPVIKAVVNLAVRAYPIRNPFAGMRLSWPDNLRASQEREPLDAERLNEVFRIGIASGFIDDALLPALAQTTSRRIGLLAYLRGSDFQTKHGVTIIRIDGMAYEFQKEGLVPRSLQDGREPDRDLLGTACGTNAASRIGPQSKGTHSFSGSCTPARTPPTRLASSRCGRLLKKAGAIGCNIEVPHALRHGAKDAMVDASIKGQNRSSRWGRARASTPMMIMASVGP